MKYQSFASAQMYFCRDDKRTTLTLHSQQFGIHFKGTANGGKKRHFTKISRDFKQGIQVTKILGNKMERNA